MASAFSSHTPGKQELARRLGIEVVEAIDPTSIDRTLIERVPYAFVKRHLCLPLSEEGGVVRVAIADPVDLRPLEDLQHLLQSKVEAVFSPKEIISSAINDCYNTETGAASRLLQSLSSERGTGDEEDVEVYDLLDAKRAQNPIIRLLNFILTEAIQQRASDIHFEPMDGLLRIRYRIDGVLQNRHAPPPEHQGQLMTRIKVMAKLDIAERRLPQDGRIRLAMGDRQIDFRVSTLPVAGGERIVLRILDRTNLVLGLNALGMLPHDLRNFSHLIRQPEGLILVTGPTGSGKTTSLYSAITELYSDETNIMTVEDPVEYNLRGIAQIGVQPKIDLTFAKGLRHILRQDPDVVMVGEIRDSETADIAIQAAMTGHLVLSTLHTNDATSAFARLDDMGVERYKLASCIIGVQAQRLVRKICPHCREKVHPEKEELALINLEESSSVYEGKGCERCYGSGYSGRRGIYELLLLSDEFRRRLMKSTDAVSIRDLAKQAGMTTLRQHGMELVRQGHTTIAEVIRVTR